MAQESRAAYGRDRSRSPKLTSWGCVSTIVSNSFSKPTLPPPAKPVEQVGDALAYGFSSAGIGSCSPIFRILFGACFRKKSFISGVNSPRRWLIASELKAPATRLTCHP